MSFDGVFTHCLTAELKEALVKGRISKIHQPYDNEIILIIRNHGQNHKLLLSAHPSFARMQLTTMAYQNPPTPPNFCLMLRKHLEGAILEDIQQIDNDRVIHFTFTSRDELGDLEELVLIVELMGRHSTLVLVNRQSNKILDCIKHIGIAQNSYRTLLPGATYIEPPRQNEQLNPWQVEPQALFALLATATELSPNYLQTHFQGLGFDTASELAFRLANQPQQRLQVWQQFWRDLQEAPQPSLTEAAGKTYFSPLPWTYLHAPGTAYANFSLLLDAFYDGKAERDRVKQQAGELMRRITSEHKKTIAKIKKLAQELLETENAEIFRQKGELLTTYLHQVKRGQPVISLPNYYAEEALLEIQLRTDLSPAQNAQKYFQRYGKLKNSVKIVSQQIEMAEKEALYLESVLAQLELATPLELDYIREELIQEKYIRAKNTNNKRRQIKASRPEKYQSSDGTAILVGKNNLQNDQLTLRTANKNHFWLHAKDIPGSHVIVESATPSEETLLEAANLAGYFSKYRLSSAVPIDYVQVKHVKKPNGAKPGYVIYEQQKTLYVTPDEALMQRLKE